MISRKLDRLESITRRQQAAGTEKLRAAEIAYNDGTIQGVMEHIPAQKGGGGVKFTLTRGNVMKTAAIIFGEQEV